MPDMDRRPRRPYRTCHQLPTANGPHSYSVSHACTFVLWEQCNNITLRLRPWLGGQVGVAGHVRKAQGCRCLRVAVQGGTDPPLMQRPARPWPSAA